MHLVIPAHREGRDRGIERRTGWIALALTIGSAVTAVTLSTWWAMNPSGETRALERLSADERNALFHRTWDTLRTACAGHTNGLEEFCREQARFILQFADCRDACQKVARDHLPFPLK